MDVTVTANIVIAVLGVTAAWVQSSGPALGNPTLVFVIAGHAASGCVPAGNQWWLSTQGEMVNAWADLSVADAKYCKAHPGCTDLTGYYKNLADELALSIADNTPAGYAAGAEPTADSTETCCRPAWPIPRPPIWPACLTAV